MREIGLVLDASALRDARVAWQAAQYTRFAYHSPNDMPDRPSFKSQVEKQSQADTAYVRAWMKAMHNSSRKAHGR